MSIVTKTGDRGTTGLLYNRRVPKTHPRIEACGAVDELNAALGWFRVHVGKGETDVRIQKIQKELVLLMGEIATHLDDLERYRKDGYELIAESHVKVLDDWTRELESQKISFKGWATPGGTVAAAAADLARTACRRSERRLWGLIESGEMTGEQIPIYLNRLSDLLWLLARKEEGKGNDSASAVD